MISANPTWQLTESIYREAIQADEAWSAELQRIFRGRAGDARYDSRGTSTPKLRELYARFAVTRDAWLAEMRRVRESQ